MYRLTIQITLNDLFTTPIDLLVPSNILSLYRILRRTSFY